MRADDRVVCTKAGPWRHGDGAKRGALARKVPKLDHVYTVRERIYLHGLLHITLLEFDAKQAFPAREFRRISD